MRIEQELLVCDVCDKRWPLCVVTAAALGDGAVRPSPTWRRTAGPALALGLALALSACSRDTPVASGDRSSSEASTTTSSPAIGAATSATTEPPPSEEPPPAASTGPDPVCGGLDLDLVRQVLGPKMKSYLAEVNYCIYARPRDQRPRLIVSAISTLGDPAEFTQEARDACESDLTDVPNVGDSAFVCYFPAYGPQGYVVDGNAFVQLDLASGDDQADLASLLELVPYVEVPTGLEIPE